MIQASNSTLYEARRYYIFDKVELIIKDKLDKNINLESVFNWITQLSNLHFDQCIAEFLPEGWIHISYKICDNRKEVLVAYKDDNNKTKYRKPIKYKGL